MDLDLAINNGTVINACGIFAANIGIRAGKIAVLYESPLEARRVVDATGQWVLPGVIDPHVHFALRQGQGENAIMTEDDYETGPIAAAVGGVTTFIDFGIAPCDVSPREYLETRITMAEAGSCIDFGFHAGVCTSDPGVLEEFPGIVERGIPSFKFFVTYKKWGFAVDLGFLLSAMQRLQELNGIACLHAEHDEILEYLRNGHADQESLMYHSWTRPDFSEEISVYDAVVLARETKCNLYIVHLSTEKALKVVRQAQASNI